MYTTLSPCIMCTGACLLFGVSRVVIGENATFLGGEDLLKENAVEVVVLRNEECRRLMKKFAEDRPDVWYVIRGQKIHWEADKSIGTRILENDAVEPSIKQHSRRLSSSAVYDYMSACR